MKIIMIMVFGLTVLFSFNLLLAKVWRVDNNAANKPDFTCLQAAYDAASTGDTLYIAGHGNSYGGLEISKQIVIIGVGYFIDYNLNNGVNPFESKIDFVLYKNGSENSIIMSCSIGRIEIQCNNIIIKRNKILGANNRHSVSTYNVCSGIVIQQCFIQSGIQISGDNFLIKNNFISGSNVLYLGPIALSLSSSGIITNNVINGYEDIIGAIIENNIFIDGISRFLDCIERNNITGDKISIFNLTGNEDAKYILKEGSPAIGAGANGVDCGMFGRDEPYILSGIPPIPNIYEAIVPSTVTNKDGLPVQIKARANK